MKKINLRELYPNVYTTDLFLRKWQVILIFTHIIIIFSVNFRRLIKIVFKSARKFTCVLIP